MNTILRSIYLKNFLFIIVSLSFINSHDNRVIGEVFEKNYIDEVDFESALNKNSIQFHEYENPTALFDDFFGLDNPLNESSFKTNFQDLSLQIDSKNLRELYKEKLLEMTRKSNKNNEDKSNWSFFNKKI